jgi:hypothetical protein
MSEDNIKMDLKYDYILWTGLHTVDWIAHCGLGCIPWAGLHTVGWIHLVQGCCQWLVLVNTILTFVLHKESEMFCLVLVVF